MSFTAKYSGACNDCGDRIHEGDQVEYRDNQITHVACDATPAPQPVCHQCFLTIATNGTCGCEEDQ